MRAGDVDWVAKWTEMCREVEAVTAESNDGEDRWKHRAQRFDRVCRSRADPVVDLLRARARPGDVVADLGAGTGRHIVPLAAHVARAFAVEPSPAMRGKLEARLEEENIRNVEVVPEAWPCALDPVDVTYSVHVLYAIADAPTFLRAMTLATRRTCALVLGLRAPADSLGELFEAIHQRARPRRPAALEAFALLHQLGFEASLSFVGGSERPLVFTDSAEDLGELCHRLGIAADEAGHARVRSALERLHPRAAADAPWDLGATGPNALIEWSGRLE